MKGKNRLSQVRFIFLLLAGQLFATSVHGQEINGKASLDQHKKPLISKIEFLAGPSIIRPYGNKDLKDLMVSKFGFAANAGIAHSIRPRIDIALKLQYENKGEKFVVVNTNVGNPPATLRGLFNYTINYVTVSVLPRFVILPNKKLYVGLGSYVGLLLNTKFYTETKQNGVLVAQSASRPDPKMYYRDPDLGLRALLGYDFKMTKKNDGSVQVMYGRGLRDINKARSDTPFFNATISLLVGISINKN